MALYDVLKVVKVNDLGPVDFDEEVKKRNQRVYIPNWFTVDLKIGVRLGNTNLLFSILSFCVYLQMPTIVLGQDEVDCFAAWVSAESGLPEHAEPGSELKVRCNSIIYQTITTNVIICLFR